MLCLLIAATQTLAWLILFSHVPTTVSFSNAISRKSQFYADLQKCVTPEQVLAAVEDVAAPNNLEPSIASLVLVRLSKQLIVRDNHKRHENVHSLLSDSHVHGVRQVVARLAAPLSIHNVEALTEGTKAYSVLLRLMQHPSDDSDLLIHFWTDRDKELASRLEPQHLSGLKWSFDTLNLVNNDTRTTLTLPKAIQDAYNDLNLPFTIIPGCLQDLQDLNMETITSQVEFRTDDIKTSTNAVVKERRQTEWQGDDSCGSFLYSSKSMPRSNWSPIVRQVRDVLYEKTNQYYDGCLLNLYRNGQSGMRYHADPDQGTRWDYDTAVVSIGACRRFAFRSNDTRQQQQPHSFVVMHGDVTHMFDDCQERYQHTVKKADNRNDESPRASLVFKRTYKHTLD
jgi:alkylated DNA repair dioxygenase AlkB